MCVGGGGGARVAPKIVPTTKYRALLQQSRAAGLRLEGTYPPLVLGLDRGPLVPSIASSRPQREEGLPLARHTSFHSGLL